MMAAVDVRELEARAGEPEGITRDGADAVVLLVQTASVQAHNAADEEAIHTHHGHRRRANLNIRRELGLCKGV